MYTCLMHILQIKVILQATSTVVAFSRSYQVKEVPKNSIPKKSLKSSCTSVWIMSIYFILSLTKTHYTGLQLPSPWTCCTPAVSGGSSLSVCQPFIFHGLQKTRSLSASVSFRSSPHFLSFVSAEKNPSNESQTHHGLPVLVTRRMKIVWKNAQQKHQNT